MRTQRRRRPLLAVVGALLAFTLLPLTSSYASNPPNPFVVQHHVYPLEHAGSSNATWISSLGLFQFSCDREHLFTLDWRSNTMQNIYVRGCINYVPTQHLFGLSAVAQIWQGTPNGSWILKSTTITAAFHHRSGANYPWNATNSYGWVYDGFQTFDAWPLGLGDGPNDLAPPSNDDKVWAAPTRPQWSSDTVFPVGKPHIVQEQVDWFVTTTYEDTQDGHIMTAADVSFTTDTGQINVP